MDIWAVRRQQIRGVGQDMDHGIWPELAQACHRDLEYCNIAQVAQVIASVFNENIHLNFEFRIANCEFSGTLGLARFADTRKYGKKLA